MVTIDAEITGHLIYMAGGGLASLVGAYFVVGKDLSYIKGQLSLLMGTLHQVDKLKESVALLERTTLVHAKDLDSAFQKLREYGVGFEVNGHGA